MNNMLFKIQHRIRSWFDMFITNKRRCAYLEVRINELQAIVKELMHKNKVQLHSKENLESYYFDAEERISSYCKHNGKDKEDVIKEIVNNMNNYYKSKVDEENLYDSLKENKLTEQYFIFTNAYCHIFFTTCVEEYLCFKNLLGKHKEEDLLKEMDTFLKEQYPIDKPKSK